MAAKKPANKPVKKSTAKKADPSAKKPAKAVIKPAKKPALAKTKAKTVAGKAPVRPAAGTKLTMAVPEKGRLSDLKKDLLARREAVVREAKVEMAKHMSGENRQLVDTALDEGDWAVVDISEDLSVMRLNAHRKALHSIDEVLRKIKEGTYGICEECGGEISEKRLKVLPTASLCIECQEKKEQMEAFAREEED